MSRHKTHVDYYVVLGVSRDATDEEIKKGYRKQALRWHPDKNHGDVEKAAEQFKIVAEAYQVLSDKRRRQVYDATGCNVGEDDDIAAAAAAFDLSSFRSPAEIYRQFFPEDKVFADLLDSLDSHGRTTQAGGSTGTDQGMYGASGFESPAEIYRKFFPEDNEFADILDSFNTQASPKHESGLKSAKQNTTDRKPRKMTIDAKKETHPKETGPGVGGRAMSFIKNLFGMSETKTAEMAAPENTGASGSSPQASALAAQCEDAKAKEPSVERKDIGGATEWA